MDDDRDIYISETAMDTIFGVSAEDTVDFDGVLYRNLTQMCESEGYGSYTYDNVLGAVLYLEPNV